MKCLLSWKFERISLLIKLIKGWKFQVELENQIKTANEIRFIIKIYEQLKSVLYNNEFRKTITNQGGVLDVDQA